MEYIFTFPCYLIHTCVYSPDGINLPGTGGQWFTCTANGKVDLLCTFRRKLQRCLPLWDEVCYIMFYGSLGLHNEAPAEQKHSFSRMTIWEVMFVTFCCHLYGDRQLIPLPRCAVAYCECPCNYVAFKVFQLNTYVLFQRKKILILLPQERWKPI